MGICSGTQVLQLSWHIALWWILAIHRAAGREYFPHVSANLIARLASPNRCEAEGAMDVCRCVSQVHPLAERYQELLVSIVSRRGRWPYEMCLGPRCGGNNVPSAMILG